jgi:predicted ATPase
MEKIEIVGYKSIRNASISLMPINILIGGNGSGKSNFISFFEFLYNLHEQKLQNHIALQGGIDRFLHQGENISEYISAKLSFPTNEYDFELTKSAESFLFTKELLVYEGWGVNISNNQKEARVKTSDELRAKYIRNYLQDLKKYHFHDTGMNSPFNKMSNVENDRYFLYEKGENLAAFLWQIKTKHSNSYQIIVKTIQSIAPYFSDFYLEPNDNGFLKLQWQDKYSAMIYGASNFSDGTIRFIALTTLFLQPNLPRTIIIDEPELGLHPTAIAKLTGMIKSAAAKGSQVIIATQSVELVNGFEPEDIITVDQRNGESAYNRLNNNDLEIWLQDYTIGDLWQRNIIQGGQPK